MIDGACGFAIGVDIGATSTRIGLVDSSGAMVERLAYSTRVDVSTACFISRLAGDVTAIRNRWPVRTVERFPLGLGVPGTLDRDRNTVVRCVGIPSLEGVALAKDLAERINADVSLWTDAEAATWGEYSAQTPRPRRFVHLRLGTGIGCGAVLDGQLQRLDANRTTHLEALVVDHGADAVQCICGLCGCLETVASGAALLQQAARLGFGDGLSGVEQATADGNESALNLVANAARYVVTAINNLGHQFRPDVICVGGGVVDHLPALRSAILRYAAERLPALRIEPARLGDDAGVLGAARLASRVSS